MILVLFFFGVSETKGRKPRGNCSGLPPLDSAPSEIPDDSRQALDLTPNRCDSCYRSDFGGQQLGAFDLDSPIVSNLPVEGAPFARASEADRNCMPGYSWLPHLYQENKASVSDDRFKSERFFKFTEFKKLLQLQRPERGVLRGD